jgi:Holliday junction resolvase
VSAANKAKGSLFERQLEDYINAENIKCRRLPRAGAKDIGDLAVELKTGRVICLEAKNVKVVAMKDFLRQAEVESDHYEEKYKVVTYGAVAVKARQSPMGETRITFTLDEFVNLLRWEGLV